MKMLKRLFQFSFARTAWRVGRKPPIEPQLYSPVDPDEFARLLMSRRAGDLKMLARKLSLPAKEKI